MSLLIIKKRPLPFIFKRSDICFGKQNIKKILGLGTPIAFQELLVGISFLVLLAIVNSMGVIASAGVGVAEKLCGFIMLVPSSFMQAMSAFVAQNMGARKPDRANKALFYGISTSLLAGCILFYVGFFHGDLLSAIFAKDAEVILASADYLKSYALDCLFTAFLFCFMGYFNGHARSSFVMVQGLIQSFLIRLPISWYMSIQEGASLTGIGLAVPVSTAVGILLCWLYYRRMNREICAEHTLK
jgi:Na+-driven multidrug efflux pump